MEAGSPSVEESATVRIWTFTASQSLAVKCALLMSYGDRTGSVDERSGRKPIKTLSLFSGAGGLDIGFHAAGYDIVACVEIDGNYCKTLEANIGSGKTFGPDTRIFCEDVRKFNAREFAGRGIECIIGGPPCQTFSAAGRRSGGVLGTSDARGRLFKTYCEILDIIKPKMFVFENVYGLPGANRAARGERSLTHFEFMGTSSPPTC